MSGNIKFMANNLMPSTSLRTYSSEQTLFPFTNVEHTRRSKYWSPEGNFTIVEDVNDLIYINDDDDYTATLDPGDYTAAELAAEVQTQLNAVSTNWTCTYSTTTFLFTIARSSGTNVIRLSETTEAAWDTLGYTGAIDRSSDPFVADEVRCHTSEWIRIDLGVATEVKFVGLVGPIDEVFSIGLGATVTISGNNVDSWDAPDFQETISPNERGLLHFLDDDTDTSYRYWRLEINDRENTCGPEGFKFGYLYIGGVSQPTSSNIQVGFNRTEIDPSIVKQSESGNRFFDERPQYGVISGGQIAALSASDRALIEQIAHDKGLHEPFFVSLDPSLNVSTDISDLTKYVYFNSMPNYQHLFKDIFTVSLDFREAV